jgi:hypothetical protein
MSCPQAAGNNYPAPVVYLLTREVWRCWMGGSRHFEHARAASMGASCMSSVFPYKALQGIQMFATITILVLEQHVRVLHAHTGHPMLPCKCLHTAEHTNYRLSSEYWQNLAQPPVCCTSGIRRWATQYPEDWATLHPEESMAHHRRDQLKWLVITCLVHMYSLDSTLYVTGQVTTPVHQRHQASVTSQD